MSAQGIEATTVHGNSRIKSLLQDYLAAKKAADQAKKELDAVSAQIKDELGDVEVLEVMDYRVTYAYNETIDEDQLRRELPLIWSENLKEPALNITEFRKNCPELVEEYTIKTSTRPLLVKKI